MMGGGGWGQGVQDQLPIFDAEFKSAQIPDSLLIWWKVGTELSTFDAESKSAKIPNSLYRVGGV